MGQLTLDTPLSASLTEIKFSVTLPVLTSLKLNVSVSLTEILAVLSSSALAVNVLACVKEALWGTGKVAVDVGDVMVCPEGVVAEADATLTIEPWSTSDWVTT